MFSLVENTKTMAWNAVIAVCRSRLGGTGRGRSDYCVSSPSEPPHPSTMTSTPSAVHVSSNRFPSTALLAGAKGRDLFPDSYKHLNLPLPVCNKIATIVFDQSVPPDVSIVNSLASLM